jgi:outer membrane protein TolC
VTGGLLLLALAIQSPVQGSDTIPVVTLEQAVREAVRLDPEYVRAAGLLDNAEWARKAALLVFLLPSVTATADYSEFSTSQFNVGIGSAANASGRFSLDARYEIFAGGRKLAASRQTAAELEAANAGELGTRFLVALETERDYYAVLGERELLDVARQRESRAREQFTLARARVQGGATVQSDSLQVLLELQRAETEVLNREASLTVARLQLGRRVGSGGPVDAAPLAELAPGELPLALDDAVMLAVSQGPAWREARANERASDAALRGARGNYLPTVALTGAITANDNKFFPTATSRRSIGVNLSWPLWNGGQRELAIERARSTREVARAVREDMERSARRDVTEAYTAHQVANRTQTIATSAVAVADEVLRVQQARYQAGASSVLELLDAQAQLVQAQADLVQTRYAVRLARASLEAILGRRLTPESTVSEP